MFGKPAFIACHHAGDAEGEALLSEQGIAAVARSVGDDLSSFWEVDDVLVLGVTWPSNVSLSSLKWSANGVKARNKVTVFTELLQRSLTHAGHDAHVDDDVGRVG